MLKTLRALTQLLQVWWTKDRIRVARSEGKLFRIRVGDRLIVDERLFTVVSRVESDSSVAQVAYGIEEDQADSDDVWSLAFTIKSETARLFRNRDSWEIHCDQVSLLARL